MSHRWTDPRTNEVWEVSIEGRAAEVQSGTQSQVVVFRSSATHSIIQDTFKEPEEMADEELMALLDGALRG
jgi:hypothetical protein